MTFIVYDEIYDSVTLDEYREYSKNVEWDRENSTAFRNMHLLKNFYPNPDILLKKYMQSLPYMERKCLEKGFEHQKGFSIDAKLAKYFPGDYFDWHCDDWVYNYNLPTARRILTSITYLNDDFVGGETEFSNIIITPKSGKTLIFPSFWAFPHTGREIISGEKLILVMHVWA